MKNIATLFIVVIGAVNVLLFLFWVSLVRVEVSQPNEDVIWRFDQIAFQITILEVVFVLVGIVFAILGVFGFQTLLERAESRADSAAREAVQILYKRGDLGLQHSGTARLQNGSSGRQEFSTQSATGEEDV